MSAPLAFLALATLLPAAVQALWPALARRLLARRSAPLEPPQAASLSVLIPVSGEEPGLEEGLVAALAQSWPGHEFEVLIVAADAGDPALAAAARALARVPGRGRALSAAAPPREPGKAPQLAAAAAAARGEWLVLLDSDARLPDPDYLRRFCAPLAEPAIGLVTCLPVHRPARSLPARALAATLEPDLLGCFAMLDAADRLDVANGACLAIRRDLLRRSAGLDAMRGRLLMDAALARAVRAAGGRVRAHGEPLPVEAAELGWRNLSRQSHRWLAAILRGLPLPAAVGFVWLRSGVLLALVLAAFGDPVARVVAALALATRLASALALRRALGAGLTLASAPLQLLVDAAAGVTWVAAALDPRVSWRGKRWRVGAGARIESREGAP
jgi:ceramide glucosyltransferase